MRLVNLNRKEFPDEAALQEYFAECLPRRKGVFTCGRQIATLKPGETILFSYDKKLRYVATAKTGREKNQSKDDRKYKYCFSINLPARKADVLLEDVQRELHAKTGFRKSLLSQGWTIIDDERAEEVIEDLLPDDSSPGGVKVFL